MHKKSEKESFLFYFDPTGQLAPFFRKLDGVGTLIVASSKSQLTLLKKLG